MVADQASDALAHATTAPALLSGRGLTKVYHAGEVKVHALRRIDIDIQAGEMLVMLGASGSGKSTLLNILGGLDRPTEAEEQLRAAVDAARSAITASSAELDRMRAELRRAEADAQRYHELAPEGAVSRQTQERAEAEAATLQAAERAAQAAFAMRRQELAAAQAALRPSGDIGDGDLVDVVAPIDGVLLQRPRKSEGPFAQGAPLIQEGNPEEIEIVADLLSEDAVQVSPGDPVVISDWGGPPLQGEVRRIEPFAFTKVSALGVEEQRVNVIIEIAPGQPVARLGHGYRVDVAAEVWSADDEIIAPMSALFKQDRAGSVYRIEGGHARLRTVSVGQMNGRVAQILSGLEAGDLLVEHPSSRIEDRVKVHASQEPESGQTSGEDAQPAAELADAFEEGTRGCDFPMR